MTTHTRDTQRRSSARKFEHRASTHVPSMIACSAVMLALAGCAASVDPEADINRAEHVVTARANPEAPPAWAAGWDDALLAFDATSPLTEQHAIALALRANRQLRADIEAIAAARADLVQAGLLPNPVLALTLRLPVDAAATGTFVGAQAVQSFTSLWLRPSRIAAADARLNASVLNVSDRALSVAARVRSAFARAHAGEAMSELAAQRAHTLRELSLHQELRQRAGASSSLDVALAHTRAAQGEADLANARLDAAIARRELLELMGIADAPADFALAPQGDTAEFTSSTVLSESEAMAIAASQRLDIAAARAIAQSHAADLTSAERSRLDDIFLGLDFERSEGGDSSLGPTLEIPVPIFDTGHARIAKAGADARAALFTAEAVAQRATREVRSAWVAAEAAEQLETSARETLLPAAHRAAALSESARRAGEADAQTTLGARLDILEAKRTAAQATLQRRLAHIELRRSLGS